MMRLSRFIIASIVIGLAGMNAASAAGPIVDEDALANLIVDGGFESPVLLSGTLKTFYPGTAVRSWLIIGSGCANVALVSTTYSENRITFSAQAGNQSLDLTGAISGNSGCPTGVQQGVRTIVGHTYRLTFWVGNIYDPGYNGARVDVFVNDVLATSVINTGGAGMQSKQFWLPFTYQFTATTAHTLIAFLNGNYFGVQCGLDSVSLTDVTAR
jgi:hypothetical protein